MRVYIHVKRIADFVLAFVNIIALIPLFLLLFTLIKIESPGPVLFKQKRITKGKKVFNIYKFRTMRVGTPKNIPTHILNNPDVYITKIGKFLRKISLDELPQLWNILKGEMSFVGPRPALWNQYNLISKRDKYDANNIRPGLTGLAQICGRDELKIDKKAELDGEYVKNISFLMDIKIFFKTFVHVFKSNGVVEGGTGMLREKGNKE
ncbi:MAG: sugar transferase [Streptococcaceae bacterium]|jgi:O-antigen biosynthesis protein WbqP|nr:sugar transferase [Streptococcaceae bacterium]